MTLAEQQLQLYISLPRDHQRAADKGIKQACYRRVWRSRKTDAENASATAELFGEVMAKLIFLTKENGVNAEAAPVSRGAETLPARTWKIDTASPEDDERVLWLVQGVTNWRALNGRDEDIRRTNWGRWGKGGYRLSQIPGVPNADHGEDIGEAEAEYLHKHAEASYRPQQFDIAERDDHAELSQDSSLVWFGLLSEAEYKFKLGDDARTVLNLFEQQPDIREAFNMKGPGAGTGTPKWPVGQIRDALNASRTNTTWTGRRVELAQAKIARWLISIKRSRGLRDWNDVRYLFARIAIEIKRQTVTIAEEAEKPSVIQTTSENSDYA